MQSYFAIAIFGPRQCGKTTLVRNLYPDFSYANLEDINTRRLALEDPYEFFTHFPEPVIIDEIQRVPELLSTVQARIDENHKKGQYIITGSQQIPLRSTINQSLAGRIALIQMSPLSLSELKASNIELPREVQLLSGCMPFLYSTKDQNPTEYYKNYIQTYLERDIAQLGAVQNLMRFEAFLRLLAGRTGQLVNNSALAVEVGVSSTTIGSWLSILETSHLVHILRPWYENRSNQVVKTPKVYFCDTGLLCYLLGIETPQQVQRDPLLRQIFENLVVCEAIKARYNYGTDPNLYFFRNSKSLEIDLILNLFEIKSGQTIIDDFTKNMEKFRKLYPSRLTASPVKGTVIYSGTGYSSYKDYTYVNFHDTGLSFIPRTKPFILTL